MSYTDKEITELCNKLAEKIKSIEKKDIYTQALSGTPNRFMVGKGGGDCSSTVQWVYNEVLKVNIGGNTTAQVKDSDLVDVPVKITNGIPRESDLQVGDLLFFKGSDLSRSSYGYVGHVEMYLGNNTLSGHGSGIGPTEKNMTSYCTTRYKSSSPNPIKNKGLFLVRRAKVLVKSNKAKLEYYPKCDAKYNSLVDALNSLKINSSKEYRLVLAKSNGITNYNYTATQNNTLLNLLKQGKLIKPTS